MRAERYSLNVARAATVVAPMVLFLALPPFYNGVWVQVEGAMPWLHLAAGVTVIGLGVAAACNSSQALAALRHPLVILPAALFTLSILLLFVVLGIRGMRAALRLRDPFARLAAFGITSGILLQAFFNISVVLALLPTKGIPLPFISYGGTSVFFTLASVGILLNLTREID